MLYNYACSKKEFDINGPLIRSAIPRYERKAHCMGSWSSNTFANLGIKPLTKPDSRDASFGNHFGPGNVMMVENRDIKCTEGVATLEFEGGYFCATHSGVDKSN